jgi:hypothetical protein
MKTPAGYYCHKLDVNFQLLFWFSIQDGLMSERDMEEVHLLQQSSMTTQHQIYTRNKMAVKI